MPNTVDLWSFIDISYKSKSINSAISWGFVDFYKYENQSLKSESNRCQMLWIFGFLMYTHLMVLFVSKH